MESFKEFLNTLIELVQTNRYYSEVIDKLELLDFYATPSIEGSILIQHKALPLRGHITFYRMSKRIGDIYLEPGKELYLMFKEDIKDVPNFQYSILLGATKNFETDTSVVFSNNIIEGRKIIIHKKR